MDSEPSEPASTLRTVNMTSTTESVAPAATTGPVPLSFPAILRNAGLHTRFAHLAEPQRSKPAPAISKKSIRRNDNEGKRWVRRSENARFDGNPHVVAPKKYDLELSQPYKLETFPVPLPPFLPRSVSLPPTVTPVTNLHASHAGSFSLSLKGTRKNLRRAGPRTQALVRAVESALLSWIDGDAIIRDPDAPPPPITFPGIPIGGIEGVNEVQRTPEQLVWWIQDDAWARYVIHCCARYHEVVSFSKDTADHRLTHLLRPNRTRTTQCVAAPLATPPATDPELSSVLSSYDSDAFSLSDIASVSALSDVALIDGISDVDDLPTSAHNIPSMHSGASDIEADVESELGGSIASLRAADLGADSDGEHAPLAVVQALSLDDDTPRARRVVPLRASAWDRGRSGSSPSRSPARRERRPARRAKHAQVPKQEHALPTGKSFYDYLFS